VLTHPLVCGVIYTSVLSLWHLPSFYDLALQNRLVHIAEHFMFFGAGLFYWWPVLSPATELPRVSFASQIIYLTAVIIAMTPLFAYITFSTDVLYRPTNTPHGSLTACRPQPTSYSRGDDEADRHERGGDRVRGELLRLVSG